MVLERLEVKEKDDEFSVAAVESWRGDVTW